jgi:very-short-patch-repair endonuclease
MHLTIEGESRSLIPIKDFRAVQGLLPDFGVAFFEPKDYNGLGRIDRAGAELNRIRAALLDALPQQMDRRGWLAFLPGYVHLFENQLYIINDQVGLKDVEIEFAVAGLSDVLHHLAYKLVLTPPPSPLPASEKGESDRVVVDDLSPYDLRGGVRQGISGLDRNIKTSVPWQTPREIYDAIKLLAQQMRKEPTPAEAHLWKHIRNKQLLGYKFRRQHSIDRFIVDFYCPDAKLVIEVDGPIHDYTVDEDTARQAYLESLNLRVLRFTNDEVLDRTTEVMDRIAAFLQSNASQSERQVSANVEGISDSPHRLRGGVRGGVNPASSLFRQIYNEWLDNSLKVFSQIYSYEHQGQVWQVQIIAHAYGRAGMVIHAGDETYYVYDATLGCPAEGFMATLLADIAARMLVATV